MVSFTSVPAFGFETATCNAEGCYKEMSKKVTQKVLDLQKREMAKLNIPELQGMPDITADPEYQKVMEEQYNNAAKGAWKTANIVKALGYIPLIGTLIGLSRISRAAKATQEELPNKFNHIARGCIELFSLGFLLLIPDLILTGYRARHAGNTNPSIVV